MQSFIITCFIPLLLMGSWNPSTWLDFSKKGAILEAEITTMPFRSYGKIPEHIQPGSQIKLIATIKNIGTEASEPGSASIRFVFYEPLDTHQNSLLFATEKQPLPSIAPGKEVKIPFSKMHQWPSLYDYIRDDWAMRRYQVVATIDDNDYIIGTKAISFSAHYYEGPSRRTPVTIPKD